MKATWSTVQAKLLTEAASKWWADQLQQEFWDCVGVVGAVLVIFGVGMVYLPAAVILTGIALVALAYRQAGAG